MSLDAQQLDDLYTDLCYRMTEAGEAATAEILARLALLLMHALDDAPRIAQAIDEALEGYPRVVEVERPV